MTINLGTLNERKHTVLTFSQIYVYRVLICSDTWVGSCEGGYSTSVMCWLELQRWIRFLVLRNLLVTTECGVRILLSTPTLSLDSFLVTYIIFSLTIVFLVNLCACVICMCRVYVKTHGSQKKTRLGNWTRVLYKSSKPSLQPKMLYVYLFFGRECSIMPQLSVESVLSFCHTGPGAQMQVPPRWVLLLRFCCSLMKPRLVSTHAAPRIILNFF